MKTLCAKCKVPLERRAETGIIFCPRCGDSLRPGAPEPQEGADGTGRCPDCGRDLEFDMSTARPFCPGCDDTAKIPPADTPKTTKPASKPKAKIKAKPKAKPTPVPKAKPAPAPRPTPQPSPPPVIELPPPAREPVPPAVAEDPAEEEGQAEGLISATRLVDGCRILTFEGQVGEREYVEFKEAVRRALLDEPRRLIVDLGGMTYISSSGLSVLIWAHGVISGSGQRMIVANVHPRTLKLFKLINVDRMLEIVDSAEEALALPDPEG